MTLINRIPALLALVLALAVALPAATAAKPELPERYKQWLDEEVVYITTSTERDVFQKLTTDRERDLFIEAFWKHRDPTPDSAANEFKTEHYRRIAYANQYLGREAPVPGWKTDRGRMYIILGEPMEKQNFTGRSGLYDCETWFFQGMTDKGLPAGFYLLFFKEHGTGSYRLYSPSHDGPQSLLSGYVGDPSDYVKAYETLREIDVSLAGISVNLVPGEDSGLMLGRPSTSSDILIQRIDTLPSRTGQEKYARKFLEYKDLVDVEYSANYLDCDSLIKVFREPNGLYFVHYSIEPQRLSVNQYEKKYYATLKVNGRVTTMDGRLVYQYDKTVSLDMDEAQMAEAGRAPFEYHDVFPLVPGDFKLSILVKNEASKEFMSIEQAVRIPEGRAAVQMTQPVLGYKVTRVDPAQRKIKAFKIGPYQIYCQPGRLFTAGDTLAVGFQLNGLSGDLAQNGLVRIAFLKDDKPFREITRKPSDYQDLPDALEQVPLSDFPPAHYKVRVSLLKAGAEVVSAGEEFDLSYAAALPRPWFHSRVLPAADDPIYDRITGSQLFNLGRYDEALLFHEKAHRARPDSVEAAYGLAQVYAALGRYPQAVRLLTPFLGKTPSPAYEIYVLAGEALRKSGDFAKAVEVLDQAVAHYGVNASVLNAIGESYLGLGKRAEALASFDKSLQLSPEQPEVRKKAEELRKGK
ncbi:MAG: GWxTD domain-containing protein [Candidatus Aminicenantales bacterium]